LAKPDDNLLHLIKERKGMARLVCRFEIVILASWKPG
jgi:hypothetical protein